MRFLGVNPGEHPEYIVVGLGNPGKRYENTRHNIGFEIVDYIDSNGRVARGLKRMKHFSLTDKCVVGGYIVFLAKPQTFMNNSGMAVKDILDYYSMPPQKLIVIHDDISLRVGTFRINNVAHSSGHNGVKSIVEHLGTDEFARLCIGVGPKPEDCDMSEYVLSRFTDIERKELDEIKPIYKQVLERIFDNGVDETMELFNKTLQGNCL